MPFTYSSFFIEIIFNELIISEHLYLFMQYKSNESLSEARINSSTFVTEFKISTWLKCPLIIILSNPLKYLFILKNSYPSYSIICKHRTCKFSGCSDEILNILMIEQGIVIILDSVEAKNSTPQLTTPESINSSSVNWAINSPISYISSIDNPFTKYDLTIFSVIFVPIWFNVLKQATRCSELYSDLFIKYGTTRLPDFDRVRLSFIFGGIDSINWFFILCLRSWLTSIAPDK